MQILTPSGYKDIADCAVGDAVSAFDIATGAPIINTIETLQWVDAVEWERWWQVEAIKPPFQFYRINGKWRLNSEQSIWRNGGNVCHAKHLIVGDVIYDDSDRDVTITTIEEVTAEGWWRFDISGDHSYIVDGLTVHNASRFLITGGGSVSWTAIDTSIWSATSGGSTGASVPGSADAVTMNASSGGGTVTLNFGGTVTLSSMTSGAFTGTFDNSVNNNNMTLSSIFDSSGSGVRTLNLGTATYTLTSSTAVWQFSTVTNLTFTAGSSSIVFSGASAQCQFTGGGKSYGSVSFGASSGSGFYVLSGSNTYASLNITAPNRLSFPSNSTISSAFAFNGSSLAQILLQSTSTGTPASISATSGSTAKWTAFKDITFTSSTPIASDSFDLGNNTGVTINPPGGTGTTIVSGAGVIGS